MEPSRRETFRVAAEEIFRDSIAVKEALVRGGMDLILDMAEMIARAFRGKHRLFLFGNGGSAADAQHLAAEFINRFQMERPPLPAVALTVDTSVLTSISNDYQFEDIFQKQLQGLAQAGDVALGISTSGRSPNVVKALRWAREHGVQTIGWAGMAQGDMDLYCDLLLHVPSKNTARIQEGHITVGHIVCALVDEMLYGESEKNA
jgi:D-sedoheptulose 7-phosphate isomerase